MPRKPNLNRLSGSYDASVGTPEFLSMAYREDSLGRLTDLFTKNIKSMHARNHLCPRLVVGKYAAPLFGNCSEHAEEISYLFKSNQYDYRKNIVIYTNKNNYDMIIGFMIDLPLGDPLILSIGYNRHIYEAIDIDTRSKLAAIATIYAMKALPLWEIEEDLETASPLTLMERTVLAMILTGLSRFEIAHWLDRSVAAVTRHIGNAIEKVGGRDEAEAVAIAARHGWLHFPHGFGMINKTLDR